MRKRASSLLLLLVTGCAPKAPALPSGASTPFPDFQPAYEQATAACRATKTLTASMALSGRAGSTKLRGRVDGGFEAPSRARLEGIAPFGKPVFIFVADATRGTLVLPREDRVLSDAPPSQIIEALTGVALDAETLRTILAGCGFGADVPPSSARRFTNGWVSATSGESTIYLRPMGGSWQIAAASRDSLSVFYGDYASGRPGFVRVRAESNGRVTADLTLRTSEVDVNTTLDPRTFDIRQDLPSKPVPLTLDELRRAGPLGGG